MSLPGAGRRSWPCALAALAGLLFVTSACVTVDTGGAGATTQPSSAGSGPATEPAASATPRTTSSDAPASVAPGSDAPATLTPRSTEPSIGYISLDESLPYVRAVSEGIRSAATDAGIKLVACDSGWSRDGAGSCASELAQAGVHGLISFQPFADLASDLCTVMGDAPTVGIVFDQGPCQVSRLRIDQAESGRLAGAAVGAFVDDRFDCKVNAYVSLESSDADPDGRDRMQGYRDGYTEHCPLPERQFTLDDADRLITAKTQVAGLLKGLKGKPNVVVGLNEDAILGAMAAGADAGRTNHLWYSGQLAEPSIREDIACNDHYIASVAQFPERFGGPLVTTLIDAIEGRGAAPELDAELQLVTSENVRELFPGIPACDE